MKKIATMYPRDESRRGHPVMPPVKPECEWVERGEGVATRKLDGTNVKIEGGVLFKRQKPKGGDYDMASYMACHRDDPADKYLFEAFDAGNDWRDGIYEALGPKIQKNPERMESHTLVAVVPPDESLVINDAPRTFDSLRYFFAAHDMEGIVFHHEDGRLAKIKARDFQVGRGAK